MTGGDQDRAATYLRPPLERRRIVRRPPTPVRSLGSSAVLVEDLESWQVERQAMLFEVVGPDVIASMLRRVRARVESVAA